MPLLTLPAFSLSLFFTRVTLNRFEKWRAEHPVTESGLELLERILAERRAKWEAEQLAKGKDPRLYVLPGETGKIRLGDLQKNTKA